MTEESFLLVSLQDEKAKKLSQVIGSNTARKILEVLAKKKYSESDLAKELAMPISTVHYNLEQLKDAGLVKATEYHYSSKGKEVNHYELVNKLIIISPGKEKEGMFDLLKKFLSITVIIGGISLVIELYSRFFGTKSAMIAAAPMMAKTATDSAAESVPRLMAAAPEELTQTAINAAANSNYALWFLIGGLFAIALLFLWELIKRKRKL